MTCVFGSIGLNVLTNVICDIIKYVGNRFYNTKIKDQDLHKIVEKKLSENAPEEIKPILESSVFVEYFSSAQFLDVINAYIEHKIICDNANKNAKIKQYLKKSGIISNQDVIEYIGNNIYRLYVEKDVINIPQMTDIKKP